MNFEGFSEDDAYDVSLEIEPRAKPTRTDSSSSIGSEKPDKPDKVTSHASLKFSH